MTTKANAVAEPIPAYTAMKTAWNLTEALMGGTDAMRKAGILYMPKEERESEEAYTGRLLRNVLFPGYRRTLETFLGKPLEQEITIEEGTPARIVEWLKNVDMLGRDIDTFARDVFRAALNEGLTHILVDYPTVPEARKETLAEEREAGRRPYAVHVKASQVIGWKSELRDGKEVLTQVRVQGVVMVPDPTNEFLELEVPTITVYEIGRVRRYDLNPDSAQFEMSSDVRTTLNRIPLATVYTNRTGYMQASPPLLDLAHLNVAHWQSMGDQRTILHIARVPFLHIATEDPDSVKNLVIGVSRAVTSGKDTVIKWIEHTGSAIQSGSADLESLKQDMASYGMEFMLRAAAISATQSVLDKSNNDSSLSVMARALKIGLEEMMLLMHIWAGGSETDNVGGLDVQTDFAILGSAEELKTLWDMRMNGDLSQQQFWLEMRRRGILDDNFDPDKEREILSKELARPGDFVDDTSAGAAEDGKSGAANEDLDEDDIP